MFSRWKLEKGLLELLLQGTAVPASTDLACAELGRISKVFYPLCAFWRVKLLKYMHSLNISHVFNVIAMNLL